ncbi:RNA polymerase sigma factor [Desulfosporosinus sp. OT]|uniref:RNA polymerase sigma factor n=1 Tax=Desulfosporosinus sp. OT TaxID=913865 RepID=UPI000223ABAC|nr:RNA polymerase sigma factor [Desulfosporosinus sp. OT]EGW41113.1 RNA polymerase sigma factor, sigma-70 family protein [Desulfosporosinus sp. OT]
MISGEDTERKLETLGALADQFDHLYADNYEKLYQLAYRLTGNREDAEDVVQEAWLNAYRSRAQFQGKSSQYTWLFKITLRCAYRFIKKRQKRLPIEDLAARMGINEKEVFSKMKLMTPVEDQVLIAEMRESCLQMFMHCLPKQQRIAFILKILLDLPGGDVADIMEISQGAVKVNVHRARSHMKENIEGRCSLIKASNPCSCSLWVTYLKVEGKENLITRINPVNRSTPSLRDRAFAELGFMQKVIRLYDNEPNHDGYYSKVLRLKQLLQEKKLMILE